MSSVKPSAELLAVSRRWFDAVPNRRRTEIENIISEQNHVTFVGTGEDELWTGRAVRHGVADFFGVVPDFADQKEISAQAFQCGSVGWAIFTHEVSFLDDPEKVFFVRNTLVFSLEHGVWKIVHRHGSLPFANKDFTGVEQTAIAELITAAKKGFSLDQKEGFSSIMFTDIVNSSRLASIMGDRLWSSEISSHFSAVRTVIEESGGQFVKSLGDGTMSSFSRADQALTAATAILTAQAATDGPAIALRIGIHSGDVVQTNEDFFGSVVNKAARITALAAPGETRVSEDTKALVSRNSTFTFSGQQSAPLKGFDGEQVTYKLETSG